VNFVIANVNVIRVKLCQLCIVSAVLCSNKALHALIPSSSLFFSSTKNGAPWMWWNLFDSVINVICTCAHYRCTIML